MNFSTKNRFKDYCGGLILCGLGTAAALQAQSYHLGTLNRMGPGFVPMALGILLAGVGLVLLAATALRREEAAPSGLPALPGAAEEGHHGPDWRGWGCICAGVIAFAVLAEHAGLIPATLGCVAITAMGDRENTWRDAILLAIGIAIMAVAVFWWGLGVLMPLVKGIY
ncbi:tripartite tricarboxylate transporter TctB family protein [Roseomonas sp. GC11]|uniref:tripartite tricarboxylate transporter TctB family protein n=1 Tax=Roseomonas sp. GC11 TaxID=2950546 RepID=UPI00210BEF18|nr:tripartite tricarboxylate transporter TctB family protein [Roseomonas sp. GC11]MCQ4161025.1 tripartite tricarboxylate transporter TctB family protein [Roseomonas sp. GC11]